MHLISLDAAQNHALHEMEIIGNNQVDSTPASSYRMNWIAEKLDTQSTQLDGYYGSVDASCSRNCKIVPWVVFGNWAGYGEGQPFNTPIFYRTEKLSIASGNVMIGCW